jgi:dynein heavy chain
LNDNYKFSDSGKYFAPPDGPIQSAIDQIKELPVNDLPEIFGLHTNADITSAINDTNKLLDTVLSLMPRQAGGTGKSQDEILQESANGILEKIPPNFDIEYVSKKHPITPEESMNTVLQQELLRFNKLISRVR